MDEPNPQAVCGALLPEGDRVLWPRSVLPATNDEEGEDEAVRIAIAGAGVAGSYIFRLLKMRGHTEVDVFERKHAIACGIHPCGYGVDHHFDQLVRHAGLAPSSYVLHVPPRLLAEVEGVSAKTTVFMIDKPRLVADLLDGAPIRYETVDVDDYDLIVDATGEARAYSPPLRNDLKARVVQWRVQVQESARTAFMSTRGLPGYAWIMPLSRDGIEVHVGAGCRAGLRVPAQDLTEAVLGSLAVDRVICACGARIRLSGPDFGSIVHGHVWAAGEAAGLVGPASGAGNVYAMQSGLDLVSHLGDGDGYVKALHRHFYHLVPEARAVRTVLEGRLPTVTDLYHIRQGWKRAGVEVAWRDLPRLMLAMNRAFTGGAGWPAP